MALAAGVRGLRMAGRLTFRHAAVVALRAGRRHAFEHRTRVAGFTWHGLVRADEIEASAPMIEVLINFDEPVDFLRRRRCIASDQYHQAKHQ